MRLTQIREIQKLTTPEKILLIEDLWDTICSDEAGVAVPPSHRSELDKRFKRFRASQGRLLSLAELRARLARRK